MYYELLCENIFICLVYKLRIKLPGYTVTQRLFQWLSSKESTCSAGATGDAGLIPESGRSPGEGNGNPFQYSFLENSKDRGD